MVLPVPPGRRGSKGSLPGLRQPPPAAARDRPVRHLLTDMRGLRCRGPGRAGPRALLGRAGRPGRSAGTLARALEEFFTDAGLAFPLDHAARRAAARCQRRVEEAPEALRPALARYAAALVAGQQRARKA